MSDFAKDINVPANDCISRQAAIDALDVGAEVLRRVLDEADVVGVERAKYEWGLGLIESHIADVNDLPSARPEYRLDEWCTDCKEYDTERHCCPRFNQVIRTTLDEMKSERKKGKWIDYTDDGYVECPFCHSATNCDGNKDELHYCFSCGADMRGE